MEPNLDISKQKTKQETIKSKKTNILGFTISIITIGIFVLSLYAFNYFFINAPSDFKKGTIIKISQGDSVDDIASSLAKNKIVSSKLVFKVLVNIFDVSKKLQQGEYLFENKENAYRVMIRIENAIFNVDEESILIREGLTRKEMAQIFSDRLPSFSEIDFMDLTNGEEGYLFPDTYKFFKTASTSNVVLDLRKNFNFRTSTLKKESDTFGKDWNSIIIIASLLELEGKTKEDRAMISDIIYRRLEKNMPLQLDAPFLYFMNKASLELTKEDLFAESPYNTYRKKGLPPTPICNPGIDSIYAALHPIQNEYLYYLSDKNGKIYFAKTFDEHKINKNKYLKK